jgi:hypothetical protein
MYHRALLQTNHWCILQLVYGGTTSHLSTSESGRPVIPVKMGFSLKLCLVLSLCILHCQVCYSVIPSRKHEYVWFLTLNLVFRECHNNIIVQELAYKHVPKYIVNHYMHKSGTSEHISIHTYLVTVYKNYEPRYTHLLIYLVTVCTI